VSAARIHDIEAIAVDIPLPRNFGGSTYSVLKRSTVVTRLRTTDGLVSEVYNGDNRAHGPEIARLVREVLAPRVAGLSVMEGERIWERGFALTHTAGVSRVLLMEAIACVDCAVWDVVGKALGQPVRGLLGGYRERLPIISIGGYYMEGKTLADIGREMEAYRAAGMAGCKFKIGGLTPEADLERVAVARKAAGPDFVLMVDANRGWSTEEAIRFARLAEPLDLRWFEEPCHWQDDAAMMARVRRATRVPVTAGQSEITSHGVRRLLEAGAVGGRRRHRVAAGRRALRRGGRGHGPSRGVADRPTSARGRAPRHLRGVLRRSRTRSGLADDVGEPAGSARRLVRRGHRAGLRHRAGRGHAPPLSRRLTPLGGETMDIPEL